LAKAANRSEAEIASRRLPEGRDHLPLYRQEQIFLTRHGVSIPRQTMCRWMALAAFWLRPLYEEIKTTVLDGHYVQVDEPSAARQPA